MLTQGTFFLAVFAGVLALQEPPIYYDRLNALQDEVAEQDLACWQEGGVCTSLASCPSGHILNLAALGDLCGQAGDSVCCKPLGPNEEAVSQVAECNNLQAFCTFDSLCPSEFRLDGPQLCGGQEGVSCCSTGLKKKRSFGLPGFFTAPAISSYPSRRGFMKLRASGIIKNSPNQLYGAKFAGGASKFTVDAVSISKKNAKREDNNEDSGNNDDGSTLDLGSLGAVEKSRGHLTTEENCFQKGGLCRQRKDCPPEDRLGSHDLCGFQNFFTCCKTTNLEKPEPSA